MSVCSHCGGEMTKGISCRPDPITIGDEDFEPIRWGQERASRSWVIDINCRDCRTPPGGVHHPGCCLERCPACLGQALGCPCFCDPGEEEAALADDVESSSADHHRRLVRNRTRCSAHLSPRHYRT
jgi:hypothetical protein